MQRKLLYWQERGSYENMELEEKCDVPICTARGITASVKALWILGTTTTCQICNAMEEFAGLNTYTSEQHVDWRDSRRKPDMEDVQKLTEWFAGHQPFPKMEQLLSLSSGLVATREINCHNAYEVSTSTTQSIKGLSFENVKLKKANTVLTLASIANSKVMKLKKKQFDPFSLFYQICISMNTVDDLQYFLQYELALCPLSLFADCDEMLKNQKATLYSIFTPEKNMKIKNQHYVIDGGFLLHRVR